MVKLKTVSYRKYWLLKKNIPLILCSNKFNDNRGGNPIISDQIEAAAASGFQYFASCPPIYLKYSARPESSGGGVFLSKLVCLFFLAYLWTVVDYCWANVKKNTDNVFSDIHNLIHPISLTHMQKANTKRIFQCTKFFSFFLCVFSVVISIPRVNLLNLFSDSGPPFQGGTHFVTIKRCNDNISKWRDKEKQFFNIIYLHIFCWDKS